MMDALTTWSGFLGAWLLVAGPLYQGVLELREEDTDQADDGLATKLPPPAPPSPWWWLLPPVMLALRRRRSTAYHRMISAALTSQQLEHRQRFIRKATGWFVVALGGSLIAVKETWELAEHNDWPIAAFAAVLIGMLGLTGGNTVLHAGGGRRLGRAGEPPPS